MGFTPSTSGISWSERRPPREQSEDSLADLIAKRPARAILELGPGIGVRAAGLLRRFPESDYLAYEPSPPLLQTAAASVGVFAERASVEGRNLALPLPLPDATRDVVLCLDLLEYQRMDQLYMTLAEARRVLRKNGICVLRALSFGSGSRGRIAARLWDLAYRFCPRFVSGARPLDLHHYISPEDWNVLDEWRTPAGWLTRQTLILERR